MSVSELHKNRLSAIAFFALERHPATHDLRINDIRDSASRGFDQMTALKIIVEYLSAIFIMTALWILLFGSLNYVNASGGVLVATFVVFLFRPIKTPQHELSRIVFRPLRFLYMLLIFGRELFISSVRISIMMYLPRRKWNLHPGVIAVPLSAKTDLGISTFLNLITMIPGTIGLDVSQSKSTLFMHVFDASDHNDQRLVWHGRLRSYVKHDFERHVIRVFR